MRAQDQKLSRPPGPTRPARGRGLGERTLEGVVRRLQLQKSCPVKVQNVGNQKTHNPRFYALFWLSRQKLAKARIWRGAWSTAAARGSRQLVANIAKERQVAYYLRRGVEQ